MLRISEANLFYLRYANFESPSIDTIIKKTGHKRKKQNKIKTNKQTKKKNRKKKGNTALVVVYLLPVHNSVQIRYSAWPWSDSSLPMDAAEMNWITFGCPESFFWIQS